MEINKKTLGMILIAAVGFSAVMIIYNWVNLLSSIVLIKPLLKASPFEMVPAINYIKWTSLILLLFLTTAVTGAVLTLFSRDKALNIIALALTGLFIMLILFFIILATKYCYNADGKVEETAAAAITAFQSEIMLMLAFMVAPFALQIIYFKKYFYRQKNGAQKNNEQKTSDYETQLTNDDKEMKHNA